MKQHYIIANNAVAVTVDESLPAWKALAGRFAPFAADCAECPALAVDIRVGRMAEEGELIYEPNYEGIGPVTSRASRLADGSIVMAFRHIDEPGSRLWLSMSPEFKTAEIVIAPDGDDNDPYFLTHALMIAYMLATAGSGTLIFHSAAVVHNGKAYLFQGKSGTGKSTHARMWLSNIEGTHLLNDDNPIVRIAEDGTATAYGSPWSGKTHCYRNESAPIGAIIRIVRAPENELRPLAPLPAYASLTPSISFLPFMSEAPRTARHRAIERLAMTVPCYEMHCLPNPAAARTCHNNLKK